MEDKKKVQTVEAIMALVILEDAIYNPIKGTEYVAINQGPVAMWGVQTPLLICHVDFNNNTQQSFVVLSMSGWSAAVEISREILNAMVDCFYDKTDSLGLTESPTEESELTSILNNPINKK